MTDNFYASVGAQRVRLSFNPSGNTVVEEVKRKAAELINTCASSYDLDPRIAEKAMNLFEDAAMQATKLLTTQVVSPGGNVGANGEGSKA